MGIYSYTVDELKESEKFLKSIQWDLTPKAFIAPGHSEHKTEHGGAGNAILTYMLYVDLLDNKPTVMIMKTRGGSSATAGCIEDVPEDLLKEAMGCKAEECASGMYPLTDKLNTWLKNKLGIS
jgi:hypothetical protein